MFGLDESDEKPRRLKLPQMRERGIVKVMILFLPLIFAKTEKQLQKTSEVPRCVRVAPGRGGGGGGVGGSKVFLLPEQPLSVFLLVFAGNEVPYKHHFQH